MPRRTLQELAFSYRQDPESIKGSVFVEGRKDKAILDFYYSEAGCAGRYVYTVETIDFSGFDFRGMGLPTPSARSSVIGLRKYLSDAGLSLDGAHFIADRDLEDMIPTPCIDGIELTDSGALPVHLFDNRVERIFSNLVLGGRMSAEEFKVFVNSASVYMYAVRVAARRLGLNLRILSVTSHVQLANGVPQIDMLEFVTRCTEASGLRERAGEIYALALQVRDQVSNSPGPRFRFINDHDLLCIIKGLHDAFFPGQKKSEDDIEKILLATFSVSHLSGHRLFASVR